MHTALGLVGAALALSTPPDPGASGARITGATVMAGPLTRDCPVITQHPSGFIAYAWDSISVEAAATGTGTLTYQWRRNGVALNDDNRITGARTAHLRISPARMSDSGSYDVVVSDGVCAVTSQGALVDIWCYPDCMGGGFLNLAQMGCFMTRFATGHPYADCNRDGILNVADFGCFQTLFALGCWN